MNKSLEPMRRSIDESRALGVRKARNASSSERMIFSSCDLQDEKVWQKAGASSRTFDNWVETCRSVWNRRAVFQVAGIACRGLGHFRRPIRTWDRDGLTLRRACAPERSPRMGFFTHDAPSKMSG